MTEGFHLVCSSLHAKEVSLEPLFTNQVGFAALIRSQAKAQLPSNPLQCPSLATNTPTYTNTHTRTSTHTPILEAFIWSLLLSVLFARICSKLSRLQAFYVNLVVQKKCGTQLQAKSASFKKKGGAGGDTSNRIWSQNNRIEGELYCCSYKVKEGTSRAF